MSATSSPVRRMRWDVRLPLVTTVTSGAATLGTASATITVTR
ncbi:MAG TPA: hypothetical protein VNS19_14735 [Acidimicrobiales bacterium]|nr:hypothetical protein [Acidimicrobiales bacterium]